MEKQSHAPEFTSKLAVSFCQKAKDDGMWADAAVTILENEANQGGQNKDKLLAEAQYSKCIYP
ncbi:hypothetical protein SOPP22_04875 [Shewanella sp. OPT22]|nr:hypothetical protein SOPP22_04875 [Shewanella sp. OPT22]